MAEDVTQKTPQKDKPQTLFDVIKEWPPKRKLSFVAVGLFSLVLFGLLIWSARDADYRLLYANLDTGDASSVVSWLKEHNIEYRLEDGGRTIYLPADKVYEARLEMAGAGIPQGGGIGFELFDKQSFGMTDFAQKVNYQRALQGELARTIASLAPVDGARVHLALPEKRLFREQQQDATASVILKLNHGRTPSDAQVQGIVHLVAGSIEGLEAGNVTVIDADGKVLSRSRDEEAMGPMTPGMLNYQRTVEKSLEERAQSLLDRALGTGNSMVRVTAQLDFSQVEKTEEIFDPNRSAVRSEQVMEEESGQENAGGVPGVESNLEGPGSYLAGSTPSSRTEETTNYEISKTVSRTVEAVGGLKNLSVAVLVADKPAPEGGEEGSPATTPRNENELRSIETMVASALGLDTQRGDQIRVTSMPFENSFSDMPMVESSPVDMFREYWPMAKYLVFALGGLLVYLLLIRPMIKTMKSEAEMVEHYKTVEELETEMAGTGGMLPGPKDPMSQVKDEILRGQTTPAQVIKTWLKES